MSALHTGASHEGGRERILDAAQRLFVAQGYRGLAMREIAEAVGVSKPALYHYFADKEALFLAILGSYLDVMEAMLRAVRGDARSHTDCLRRLVHGILEQPIEQRALLRLASLEMVHMSEAGRAGFHARYHTQFLDPIGAIIADGVATGEFRPVDPALATWALLGILYPYFQGSSGPPPSAAVIDQVIDLYLHGVAA